MIDHLQEDMEKIRNANMADSVLCTSMEVTRTHTYDPLVAFHELYIFTHHPLKWYIMLVSMFSIFY